MTKPKSFDIVFTSAVPGIPGKSESSEGFSSTIVKLGLRSAVPPV